MDLGLIYFMDSISQKKAVPYFLTKLRHSLNSWATMVGQLYIPPFSGIPAQKAT